MPRGRVRLAAALFVILVSGYALAQWPFDFNVLRSEPPVHNIPSDGRFTFARLRYVSGPGGYYYRNPLQPVARVVQLEDALHHSGLVFVDDTLDM